MSWVFSLWQGPFRGISARNSLSWKRRRVSAPLRPVRLASFRLRRYPLIAERFFEDLASRQRYDCSRNCHITDDIK